MQRACRGVERLRAARKKRLRRGRELCIRAGVFRGGAQFAGSIAECGLEARRDGREVSIVERGGEFCRRGRSDVGRGGDETRLDIALHGRSRLVRDDLGDGVRLLVLHEDDLRSPGARGKRTHEASGIVLRDDDGGIICAGAHALERLVF